MQTNEYLRLVEKEIKDRIVLTYYTSIEELEVIQVWYCKTVQNHKGLFIVRDKSGFYPYFIEATYNGDESELYLDFYSKQFKITKKID